VRRMWSLHAIPKFNRKAWRERSMVYWFVSSHAMGSATITANRADAVRFSVALLDLVLAQIATCRVLRGRAPELRENRQPTS
jgi:hypothetical protein